MLLGRSEQGSRVQAMTIWTIDVGEKVSRSILRCCPQVAMMTPRLFVESKATRRTIGGRHPQGSLDKKPVLSGS